MTTWRALTTLWSWDPTVLLGCGGAAAWYVQAAQPLGRRSVPFMAGLLVLLLALVSPLDILGDRYLFSAHMLQHLLLILVVPPLLLLGIPPALFERLLRRPAADRAERLLGHPAVAWLTGTLTLWVWHAPALYDAALQNEGIHVLQHLCFLVASTIFWWPVIMPLPDRSRMNALGTLAYLMLDSLSNSVLGIIETFAPPGLYSPYVYPLDTLGLLPLIRQGWNLSPSNDQQLGGLLMWTGSVPVFILACIGIIVRWFAEPEPDLLEARREMEEPVDPQWQTRTG